MLYKSKRLPKLTRKQQGNEMLSEKEYKEIYDNMRILEKQSLDNLKEEQLTVFEK